jgi:hypothetical protein
MLSQDQFAGVEWAGITDHTGGVGQGGADKQTKGLIGMAAQEGCQSRVWSSSSSAFRIELIGKTSMYSKG